jgi:flagellar basal body-associated protein FliL
MIFQNLALSNWNNGVIMIAIFALVCITLVGILINFMMSGKKSEDTEEEDL